MRIIIKRLKVKAKMPFDREVYFVVDAGYGDIRETEIITGIRPGKEYEIDLVIYDGPAESVNVSVWESDQGARDAAAKVEAAAGTKIGGALSTAVAKAIGSALPVGVDLFEVAHLALKAAMSNADDLLGTFSVSAEDGGYRGFEGPRAEILFEVDSMIRAKPRPLIVDTVGSG